MKLFKLIAAFLISATMLVSCSSNTPDNKIHNTRIENVSDTTVLIAPTWGQANHYASERADFFIWQLIGGILLAVFVVAIYGKVTYATWFPKALDNSVLFEILLFLLLAGSIISFKWQASSIRWNNDKWVPKATYDKAIQEKGSTQPIWDSLRNECRIVYGPYECFKNK